MATDPKDKELTGKEAEDVQAGRTAEQLPPGEDAEIHVDALKKAVNAGRTAEQLPPGEDAEIHVDALKRAVNAGRTQPPKRE